MSKKRSVPNTDFTFLQMCEKELYVSVAVALYGLKNQNTNHRLIQEHVHSRTDNFSPKGNIEQICFYLSLIKLQSY